MGLKSLWEFFVGGGVGLWLILLSEHGLLHNL